MGLLDAIFDKEKEVTKTLEESAVKFAEEMNSPISEVQIRIKFTTHGHPYYELYRNNGTTKTVDKIREVKLDEII